MEFYSITRRASDVAECDPVVLRETKTTRLVFKSWLIAERERSPGIVDGTLVFQRKRTKDDWEDHNCLPFTSLRADEWVKFELSADEVHKLIQHIAGLYRLHRKHGVPSGKVHFLKVDSADRYAFESSSNDEFGQLLELSRRIGVDVLSPFLRWVIDAGNARDMLHQLTNFDLQDLQRLNALVGLSALKNVVDVWHANETNDDEDFWQDTLQKHAFVLSQIFVTPTIIIQAKAYVGGKNVANTHGKIADFLAGNTITKNATIIEIKTPATRLIGSKYRGTYSPSPELTGPVIQVLDQRYALQTDFLSTRRTFEDGIDVFAPQCVILAGHAQRELVSDEKMKAFELFRRNLRDVQVITFDELFQKAQQLIETFEGTIEQ